MLTAKRAREVLRYDPDTGVLYWKKRPSTVAYCCKVGAVVGSKNSKGYLQIMIDGRRYKAHRLAWLIYYGKWPRGLSDHKNGIKNDNRILNLREANDSQNKANGRAYKNNKIGLKGVYFEKGRGWRAQIRKNKKLINLGYFATPMEGHAAYTRAAKIHHGEFARA